eukprot:tig00000215_g18534.t1
MCSGFDLSISSAIVGGMEGHRRPFHRRRMQPPARCSQAPAEQRPVLLFLATLRPSAPFVYLLGAASSPPLLAVVLGRPPSGPSEPASAPSSAPDGPPVAAYRLRVYHSELGTWSDALDSPEEMHLYAPQGGSVLLWQRTPAGGWRLLLYRSEGPAGAPLFHSVCVAAAPAPGTPLPLASIYRDQLVWAAPAPAGGRRRTLLRLDLDKDDDGVFDGHDAFPLDPEGTWDSDNDGIADEVDVIAATGACVTSGVREACMGDNAILYTVWACFFVAMCAVAAVYAVVVRRASERHRAASVRARLG